jgi:hypothetical protein
MADQSIPVKNQAFQLRTTLVSQANTNVMQNPPTLAAGDVRVKTDAGAWGNSTNAPTNDGDVAAQVLLTAAEMNGDVVLVAWADAVGAEWQDQTWVLFPTESPLEDLLTAINAVCGCVSNAILTFPGVKKVLQQGQDPLFMYRGDTWTQTITGLGDLTGNADIWFGIKDDKDDLDAVATVLISRTAGLEIINGAAATVPANGSIAVVGAPTGGVITVTLAAVETAKLTASKTYFWDVQKDIGGTITTPECGKIIVSADIVRTTS